MKIRLVFLASCISTFGSAQVRNESTRTARLDSIMNYVDSKYHFNGIVLIAQKDSILYERIIGNADNDNNIPFVRDSKFRLGSISKQFTAFIVLRLCEQGRVKMEDSISIYLSAFRNTDKQGITIRQLLTHTSGLVDYTNLKRFNDMVAYSSDSLLAMVVKARSHFQAGTNFQYCNSNYYILAQIAEKVTGKRFGSLLKELILTPAGMTNSGEEPDDDPIAGLSKSYVRKGDNLEPGPPIEMKNTQGGGGMYSTSQDLLLWSLFLQHRLRESAFLKESISPFLLPADRLSLYSCGWGLAPGIIFHTGHINGFANLIAIDTILKQTFIFLTNTDFHQLYVSLWAARQILAGDDGSMDWIRATKSHPLEDYTGTYSVDGLQVEIKAEYPDLAGYVAGNKDLLKAYSKDEFFFNDREGLVRFKRDSTGKVISLNAFQDYEWVEMRKIR